MKYPDMKIIAMPGMPIRTKMDYVITVNRQTARIAASVVKIILPAAGIRKIIPINTEIKTVIQYETKIKIAFSEIRMKKIKKVTEIVSMIGFRIIKINNKG